MQVQEPIVEARNFLEHIPTGNGDEAAIAADGPFAGQLSQHAIDVHRGQARCVRQLLLREREFEDICLEVLSLRSNEDLAQQMG